MAAAEERGEGLRGGAAGLPDEGFIDPKDWGMAICRELKARGVVFEVEHLADADCCRSTVPTSAHSGAGDCDQVWVLECDAFICVVWIGVNNRAQLIQLNVPYLIRCDVKAFQPTRRPSADASIRVMEQQQVLTRGFIHKATVGAWLNHSDLEGHATDAFAVHPVGGGEVGAEVCGCICGEIGFINREIFWCPCHGDCGAIRTRPRTWLRSLSR